MDANTVEMVRNELAQYVRSKIEIERIFLARYGEGTYDRANKERANLELSYEFLAHPDLETKIIDLIVNNALQIRGSYYDEKLPSDIAMKRFMFNLKEYLHPQQIVRLAHLYNEQLKEQTNIKR